MGERITKVELSRIENEARFSNDESPRLVAEVRRLRKIILEADDDWIGLGEEGKGGAAFEAEADAIREEQ